LAQSPFEAKPQKNPETPSDKRARVFAEGQKAISEYEISAVNVRKNMARLKELRLAKEATDKAADVGVVKKTTKKPPAKRKPSTKAQLGSED
jgi:hypothetical protein